MVWLENDDLEKNHIFAATSERKIYIHKLNPTKVVIKSYEKLFELSNKSN